MFGLNKEEKEKLELIVNKITTLENYQIGIHLEIKDKFSEVLRMIQEMEVKLDVIEVITNLFKEEKIEKKVKQLGQPKAKKKENNND